MVDGRVFYHGLDPELKGYSDMWKSIKDEFFPSKSKEKIASNCENVQIKNYEVDPELKNDLESVKEATSGLENLGKSVNCKESTS